VNKSGAVSPAARATPSRIPVIMPFSAAGKMTSRAVFHYLKNREFQTELFENQSAVAGYFT
jgi:hypothetical protein